MRTDIFSTAAFVGLLALACGEGAQTGDSSGSGSSSEGTEGDDECVSGSAYCPCFEGTCFADLTCNEDAYCVPEAPPDGDEPTGSGCTLGTLGCNCLSDPWLPGEDRPDDALSYCDGDLVPEESSEEVCFCIEPGQAAECVTHTDCPDGELCYEGLTTVWCRDHQDWAVQISDYSISCYDGVGGCELLFYKQKWDWDTGSWVSADFTALEDLLNGDYLRVSVWEDDVFSDDFINSFQVLVVDGIEAWKDGVPYVAIGDDGTDSMEFAFEAL